MSKPSFAAGGNRLNNILITTQKLCPKGSSPISSDWHNPYTSVQLQGFHYFS
jgi:hypothetical protein